MEIKVVKLSLDTKNLFRLSDAEKVRGFLGNLFWDNPYAHQHKADGSLIYLYPRVQYKIIDGECILIGINGGLDIIKKVFHELKVLNIHGKLEEILSKGLESYTASFSQIPDPISYSFLTPWLALNEKNYEKYQKFGSWSKRKELLESILVGNILSMSKSLGYTVTEPIRAEIKNFKEVSEKLKDVPMIGFLGTFAINFEIPDYWGIGKSVSRGFGTVKKVGQ
ncbi:MAG: hypothetical protein C0174_01780 [Thermodesulfobium narugense]|nr:MAG: hypothetical protein C0174_01780 [Thermodesulfobium narugense]